MAESPVEYSFWDFSDLSLGQWFQGWTSGSRDTFDNRNAFSGHSKQKAEKDDWLEIGQTYVLDDGLGSKLNVTINDVGTEDVMEYLLFL